MKQKISIRRLKPCNWVAVAARLRKSGYHRRGRSRNAEKHAWRQEWSEE